MVDGVPKNTGNAYLIKGASLPDSYAAFKAAIEAGTQGLDLNFNSAGWLQIGTALSKGNLLSDVTAELFGLDASAVPDDVFARLGKYAQYWWRRRKPTTDWEYAQSNNRNAYPDSGESGGYEYEYIGVPFEKLPVASSVEIESYVGTGTYGQNNPNTLTFSQKPKIIVFTGPLNSGGSSNAIIYYGISLNFNTSSNSDGHNDISYSGNTISWYNGTSASYQKNTVNTTYYYIVIY